MHFLEVSGLAGDHCQRCAWDLAKFVSPDVDLKRNEDCYYSTLLAGGVRCQMGKRISGM